MTIQEMETEYHRLSKENIDFDFEVMKSLSDDVKLAILPPAIEKMREEVVKNQKKLVAIKTLQSLLSDLASLTEVKA
tara:strand:+ start:176 stop:406 length:231 start_codon:yes stop_codon:yes gene_type:complete